MPTLHRARLQIYIYTGTVTSSPAATNLRYTLDKTKISTQTNILFEIAELVRDYLTHSFNDDYASVTAWVTCITTLYESDATDSEFASGSPVTQSFLAFDGFGTFEDGINPQLSDNALFSNSRFYIPEDTAGKFPILAEGVGKVIIDGVTTQITDNGNSNQKIQYITIPANSSTIQIYDTNDSTLDKTVTIDNVCEPKHTVYKVTFVNKYGAYQDMYFFKKTTESMTIKDETFKTNTIDNATVTYATYKGQRQRYNTMAQTKIELNTGFVNEDFNLAVEELLLSENVWIRFESKTLPVIPTKLDMTFKTSVNDKLINHTLQFEFAFNKINNVR